MIVRTERAKSGRAKCRGCGKLIYANSKRLVLGDVVCATQTTQIIIFKVSVFYVGEEMDRLKDIKRELK